MNGPWNPDDPSVLVVDVVGRPASQGSKVPITLKGGRTIVVEQNRKTLVPWRRDVRAAAKVIAAARLDGPLDGPVLVRLMFRLPKPRRPRPSRWTAWPIGRNTGDLDKLERAVLDALTGVLYRDDSQVVSVLKHKRYTTGPPGVEIRLRPVATTA